MNKRIKKKRKQALCQTIISKLSMTPVNPDGVIEIQLDFSEFSFDECELLRELLDKLYSRGMYSFVLNRELNVTAVKDKKELIEFFEDQLRILKGE